MTSIIVRAMKASCFDLFLRMMDEAKYVGLLFGEISAMLQFNRMPVPFATLLKRQDLHSRLVNGSDYPLPAINALIWTRVPGAATDLSPPKSANRSTKSTTTIRCCLILS